MSSTGGIELHYYLSNNKHSLDAIIRNRCEAELLGIFQEVALALDIPFNVEAQALAEGGLKEVWKWVGENATQLNVVLPTVAILIALAPDIYESKEDELSRELTELSIEEKKLQIEKLRQELKDADPRSENSIQSYAVEVLKRDPKIVVRRSNFYKRLMGAPHIESIGVTPLNTNLLPSERERQVPQSVFKNFILTSHSIKPITIEDANIEIISPVLRDGSYKWKGIFNGQPIGFSMNDRLFRSLVLQEEVTFQHGTFLECVLNINRQLDEVGEVEITSYVVATVIRKYDDRQSIETPQGRSYKHAKKLSESQEELFKDGDESP